MKMMKTLKRWPGERTPSTPTHAKSLSLTPAFPAQMPGRSFLARPCTAADVKPSGSIPRSRTSAPKKADAASIYVVDDAKGLTELYTLFLKETGCVVRAFNQRAEALAALAADGKRPDLLITDCLGDSMPVERFMQHCRRVHPSLRILMASGFCQSEMEFSQAKPDWFLQKPFTAEEFLRVVEAALIAPRPGGPN
jgi:CheY-like chemotaxis protein